MTSPDQDKSLLRGILVQARVDDPDSALKLLELAGVRSSDLLSQSEADALERLTRAGLILGDCNKIVRVLRGVGSGPGGSSSSNGLRVHTVGPTSPNGRNHSTVSYTHLTLPTKA